MISVARRYQMRKLIAQRLKLSLFFFDLQKSFVRNPLNFRARAVLILVKAQQFAPFIDAKSDFPANARVYSLYAWVTSLYLPL